jgi:integrase
MVTGGITIGAKPWNRGSRGWFVRVYADGEQASYKVGPPGPEGEREATRVCAELNARKERAALWTDGGARRLPTADMLRSWQEIHGPLRSARTRATDRALVERLARFFGELDLRDLRETDARRFAAETLKEGKSGDLVANALSVLRRTLNLAVDAGLLGANPMPQLGKLIAQARESDRTEISRPDAWTKEEAAALLRIAEQHEPALYPALCFALGTGARRGEILALRWEDIDFNRHRVHIRRAATLEGTTKAPKNRRGRFTPLMPSVIKMLRQQLARQHRAQLRGKPEPTWVFPSPTGKFWRERNFNRVFDRLRRRAAKDGIRPLSLHCTRHTFISWALESGKSPKRVSEWVGASAPVIHARYEHVIGSEDEDLGFAELPTQLGDRTKTEPNRTARGGERERGP